MYLLGMELVSRFAEKRGLLTKVILSDVPFPVHELFVVSGVPVGTVRGNHAHKIVHQYLICLEGELKISITYMNRETQDVTLTPENPILHIPPRTWASQTYLTSNTQLLVFTSGKYDLDEYFSDINDFYKSYDDDVSKFLDI